jgi:hypothetical protein
MQILNYNSKDYVIKNTISKIYSPNIDAIKHKYSADIAFANEKTIYFGSELTDIIGEEIIYNNLTLQNITNRILDDYSNYFTVINKTVIDFLVNKISYYKKEESTESIMSAIKQAIMLSDVTIKNKKTTKRK